MSVHVEIQAYVSSVKTFKDAEKSIMKRLNRSNEIIVNLVRKKFHGYDFAPEFTWSRHYYKTDAVIQPQLDDEKYPLVVVHGNEKYPVAREFIYGSTWDIAHYVRETFYKNQLIFAIAKVKELRKDQSDQQNNYRNELKTAHEQAEKTVKSIERKYQGMSNMRDYRMNVMNNYVRRINHKYSVKE